jgi:predicted flap endonuclease-1-like 5' DNA nuclease
MGFFLSKTWPWWLLAAALAALVAWLVHRRDAGARSGTSADVPVDPATVVDCGHEAEVTALRDRIKTLEGEAAGRKAAPAAALPVAVPAVPAAKKVVPADQEASPAPQDVAPAEEVVPDVVEGAKVLGFAVKPDDLKMIEGIGPKIEGLLHADGIRTWQALSDATVDQLRAVLAAAGSRYRVHNPATWPSQAQLLHNGEWAAFKTLTDDLTAGRE